MQRFKKILLWMWSVTKGFRGSILVCTLLALMNVCLGWAFVWVCKHAVDVATREASGHLLHVLLLMPLVIILELSTNALHSWIAQMRDVRLNNLLKQKLFRHLLDSQWKGIERYHTGDIVNRIEGDVSAVVTFVTDSLPGIFVLLFQLAGSFFILWYLDPALAWVVLLVLPFFLLFTRLYARRMHRITHDVRSCDSVIQSQIQESVLHRAVIKTLEQSDATLGRLRQVMGTLEHHITRRARLSVISQVCVSGGFAFGYILTFSWGVYQISRGIIGYGTMVAFLQLANRVQRPIADISRMLPGLVRSFTSAERLMDLQTLPLEELSPSPSFSGPLDIKLCDVSFAYPSAQESQESFRTFVFQHLTYTFPSSSITAILGETGVGKTTLIRMLLALIRPDSGKVLLSDGQHCQPLDAATRCYFTYVPQGNTLLSGTIRSNLLMGSPVATEEAMYEALHCAAADFVASLPEGLDTPCGESGGGLSEGQAQRIAIARALLRPAPILLLDEATSALDPQTEQQVLDNLANRRGQQTVILVTHRQAAAERCAQVLDLGRKR